MGSVVFPCGANEFAVLGGSIQQRALNSVFAYNLSRLSVQQKKQTRRPRAKPAAIAWSGKIYIFGGCEDISIEIYDVDSLDSVASTAAMPGYLRPEALVRFAFTQQPLFVAESEPEKLAPAANANASYLFGTASEPFIMQLNILQSTAQPRPVPLGLRLLSFQGGAAIGKGSFLLFGGLNDFDSQRVSRQTFEYDARQELAIARPPMVYPAYGMATAMTGGCVYACGGCTAGEDDAAILSRCQRYDVQEKGWSEIAPLVIQRSGAHLTVFFEKLFCWGGFVKDDARTNQIEFYDEQSNAWKLVDWKMPFALEGAAFCHTKPDEILIFGGKEDGGCVDRVALMAMQRSQ